MIFENTSSEEQDLIFDYAKEIFKKDNIESTKLKYFTLGITIQNDEIYTYLGLLISDQCMHTIKVVMVSDEEKTNFRDCKEFNGFIFKQLDSTYEYLSLCNKILLRFKGLERIEKKIIQMKH